MDRRWKEHCDGIACYYTRKYAPKKLVLVKEFQTIFEAREKEKQIKDWSQEKKRKLIAGEWE